MNHFSKTLVFRTGSPCQDAYRPFAAPGHPFLIVHACVCEHVDMLLTTKYGTARPDLCCKATTSTFLFYFIFLPSAKRAWREIKQFDKQHLNVLI